MGLCISKKQTGGNQGNPSGVKANSGIVSDINDVIINKGDFILQ